MMKLQWAAPTPLEYFATLVKEGDAMPLFEAAASLALDDEPQLDLQALMTEIDTLLQRLKVRLPADAGALMRLRMLHHFFYTELGFAGNRNDYRAVQNSYLHEVLRTRMGIPVSLAVVWLELARGIQLRADGVSFPGHFLVKVRLPDGYVVLDPLTGQSLSPEEIAERLEPLRQQHIVDPNDDELPLALYLQAASSREIVARMLRNLKEIHRSNRDWSRCVAVLDRLLVVEPDAWHERRDRGIALAQLGDGSQALADLQEYVRQVPGATDTADIARLIGELERTQRP